MRISDWSSDVCSSDLGDLRRPSPAARSGATGAIMGSVSSSGIGDAASTRASGRSIGRVHRFVRRLAAALIVVALLPGVMPGVVPAAGHGRSEEHTSELQSLMRISYAVFCLKKKNKQTEKPNNAIISMNTTYTNTR